MDRTDRLDLMVRLLTDRPGITSADLSRELDISLRNVFRDLSRLRDRGYPIEASRGRGGGLRLPPRWGVSRVLLSSEEALGALLSLAIADRLGLPMFAPGLGRARRKIIDAFPSMIRRQLAPLRDRLLVGPPASPAVRESYRSPVPAVAQRLEAAFVRERVVRVEYEKADGLRSSRRVEPHAILLNWPAWYLLGFDHLRTEVRMFRLDRFRAVQEEPTAFRPRPRAILAELGPVDCLNHDRLSL